MGASAPQQFKNAIEKIIDARVANEGITRYIAAIVSSVNEDMTVNVYIPPDKGQTITGLANKSGEFLEAGDSVEICAKNGSIKNAWISIKHGSNPSGTYMEEYPIGAMVAYAGSSNIPDNWLICDGRAVSRLAYSELFAIIGTTYGNGDGVTTFNIPDCRARFNIGAGTATGEGGESYNFQMGSKGGEYSHKLTANEMPSHTHDAISYYDDANYNTGTIPSDYGRYSLPYDAGTIIRHQRFENTGGDAVHNNVPPYIVVNYIIKVKNKMAIIDVGSITNSLDSGRSDMALSAAMGLALNEKINTNFGFHKWTRTTIDANNTSTSHSFTISTKGRPVFLSMSGDINPTTDTAYVFVRLYKDNKLLCQQTCESRANSHNMPFSLQYLDVTSSGTYTYKVIVQRGNGTSVLGEDGDAQAPQFLVYEI